MLTFYVSFITSGNHTPNANWTNALILNEDLLVPDQLQFNLDRTDESGDSLRDKLRIGSAQLAKCGIHLGTSSWKYPGWRGLIYDESKYSWRNRFSQTKFERDCLSEYAETFKSVCVDAAYYQFPSGQKLVSLAEQVPSDFLFSFKVTDEITARHFANIPRMGSRAGQLNPNFLNTDLFINRFLAPCEGIKENVGMLIFEFTKFNQHTFKSPTEFLEQLDQFFDRLPSTWEYGVELRNDEFLDRDYLNVLKKHSVAHVYNSWDAMPSIEEQMERIGDQLDGLGTGARLLLKPGRKYKDAVSRFSPYNKLKEANAPVRDAVARLIRQT